jgi:hypothetical protein
MALHPHIKPILYTYYPLATPITICHELAGFSFVKSTVGVDSPRVYDNSVEIDPSLLGLPWISYIPSGRQCRHWHDAEHAAKWLLAKIQGLKLDRPGDLPKGFSASPNANGFTAKEKGIITTAVNAAICLNPEATATRVALIAKVYLLAWMQDGMPLICLIPLFTRL